MATLFPNAQNNVASAIPVWDVQTGSGGLQLPAAVGNYYKAVVLNAAAGTTAQTMVTGAPGYYLTDVTITIDPIATVAVSGMVIINLTDSVSGTVMALHAYIPAVATAPVIATVLRYTNAPGFFWNNKTANSVLSASTNTSLVLGQITVSCRYGISAYVG